MSDSKQMVVEEVKVINVVTINNAFDTKDRTEFDLEWTPTKTLRDYLGDLKGEYAISISGKVITADTDPLMTLEPEDTLLICPVPQGGDGGGKEVLRLVAVIALTVVAGPAGAGIAGSSFGLGFGATAWSAGIMVAGSLIISAAFPPPEPEVSELSSEKSSPSYGIDGAKTTATEGIAVPVCYGEHRMAGNIIGLHVENVTSDNTQNVYMLLNAGEGPIVGIDRSSVVINDQPIDSYSNIEVSHRPGFSSQPPPLWFSDTITAVNRNAKIVAEGITHTTIGEVDKLKLDFVFPTGLFSVNQDTGETANREVVFKIEYMPTGGSTWQDLLYERDFENNIYDSTLYYINGTGPSAGDYDDETGLRRNVDGELIGYYIDSPALKSTVGGDIVINEKVKSSYRFSVTSSALPLDQYDIRITLVSTDSDSEYVKDDLYLSDVNEIILQDIAYNNTALLGIKVRLTDQISGIPKVTYINKGKIVKQWDVDNSVWVWGGSSNPAWIALDMLTNAVYGGGTPDERIDIEMFKEWAAFCKSKGFEYHGIFDTSSNLWDAMQSVFRAGHAQIVFVGTRISLSIERPSTPVMMFSMANIIKDSFSLSWLPMNDRANEIEVSYADKNDDYKKRTISVYDQTALDVGKERRVSSVTLKGIVTPERAHEEGKLLLNMNKYITQTVEFAAPIEAIACTIGDLIYVQHDIPQWGYAGRSLKHSDVLRGNFLSESEDVSSMVNDVGVLTPNAATGPDGLNSMFLIEDNSLSVAQSVTLPSVAPGDVEVGKYYCYSLHIRYGSVASINTFEFRTAVGDNSGSSSIGWVGSNVLACWGVPTDADGNEIYRGFEDLGGGLFRVFVAMKVYDASLGLESSFYPSDLNVTSLSSMYAGHFMINEGKSPLPYQKTTGSPTAASRNRLVRLDRVVPYVQGNVQKLIATIDAIHRSSYDGTVTSISANNELTLTGYQGETDVKRIHINGMDMDIVEKLPGGVRVESASEINIGDAYELFDADVMEERTVLSVFDDADELGSYVLLDAELTEVAEYTKWMYGEVDKVKKPFRVKSISGSHEYERKISAIEYNESVYVNDGAVYPTPNYSSLDSAVSHVTIVEVTEELVRIGSVVRAKVSIAWEPNGSLYQGAEVYVAYGVGGQSFVHVGTVLGGATSYELEANDGEYLVFKVVAMGVGTKAPLSTAPTIGHAVVGKTAPPENVAGFVAKKVEGGILLSWDANSDLDLAGYEVRRGLSWDSGEVLTKGLRGTSIRDEIKTTGDYIYHIKAVDTSGIYSQSVSYVQITIIPPSDVRSFTVTQGGSQVNFRWANNPPEDDVSAYEIREGYDWGTGRYIAKVVGNTHFVPSAGQGSRTFWIKAIGKTGVYSVNAYLSVANVIPLENRNAVFEIDHHASAFANGYKLNLETTLSDTLAMTVGKKYGEFVYDVNLSEQFRGRSLVEPTYNALTGGVSWDAATFSWADADRAWTIRGDINTVYADEQIGLYESLDADIIEAWAFSSAADAIGLNTAINGGDGPSGVSIVQRSRFPEIDYSKALVENTLGNMYFATPIPSQCTLTTWFNKEIALGSERVVLLKLLRNGTANYVGVEYDFSMSSFIVTSQVVGFSSEVFYIPYSLLSLEWTFVGVSLSPGQLSFGVYDIEQNEVVYKTFVLEQDPTVTFDFVYFYNKTFDSPSLVNYLTGTEVCAFQNMAVRSSALTVETFENLAFYGALIGSGINFYKPFIIGSDYDFQNARMRISLRTTSPSDLPVLESLKHTIDLPDVTDKGTAEIVSASSGVAITFSRTFASVPEVIAMQKGGAEFGFARVVSGTETKTGCTVRMYDHLNNPIVGTISWTAVGY